ncbi:MAG: TrkH family potassium uptake protein [Butyricicoccus pullicaecorum]|nr:TrkH family potassium uptake protein [Butyricicoccus pullicaecorum]MDO4668451.1 TrkH family potassium uptake protein [Butyricicoccus pullicaecorum]
MNKKKQFRLSALTSTQIILLGYAAIIFGGALLLMLPISSRAWQWTPFADALFTSTSATCVTGLIVVSTAGYWSLFGQLVILGLIQIGGMGFLTMAVMVFVATGRRIGLRQRFTMQESIGAPALGGIVRLTRFIFKGVLIFEGLGALALSFRFVPMLGFVRGIYYAVFHSISAFCNAGFDLMDGVAGKGSLTYFVNDPYVNMIIMLLIVIGGLGFFVWEDLYLHKGRLHRCRLHTKIVVISSLLLMTIPPFLIFLFDRNVEGLQALGGGQRLMASFFQSISARTAGFNTIDLNLMSHASKMLMIILMLIGGSSGSTAGGMKTTTIATLLLCVRASMTRENELRVFGRRMDDSCLRSAVTVFFSYICLFMGGAVLLTQFDGVPMMSAMFETSSAVATVGLSLGITPELSTASMCVLIFLMFFGRVGCLTMVYAFAETHHNANLSRLPLEKIAVG